MNSVDFLYEQDESGRGMLFLFERGKKKHMDGNTVVFRGTFGDMSAYCFVSSKHCQSLLVRTIS